LDCSSGANPWFAEFATYDPTSHLRASWMEARVNALEGMDRASAARLAGMDRQTLRDWDHRYEGGR